MRGGDSHNTQGGKVTGSIRVKGQDALWIEVGRKGFAPSGRNGGGKCFGGGGRGGDGDGGSAGGWGGGGASSIRLNKRTGTIRAVAGGAGGASGDGGEGGRGGAGQGEGGSRGGAGAGDTAASTGGTQNQAGKGGTSELGKAYWGGDGEQARLGDGGGGAQPNAADVRGGGGGGGGFYPGGGGAAGRAGDAPGVGGAGGSNYIEGMFGAASFRGSSGADTHGSVTLTWSAVNPPVPPASITIDGHPIADGLATKATTQVVVRGTPNDPNSTRGVRMLIWRSKTSDFADHSVWHGTYDESEERDKATITGLDQNTRYYLRIYTQDINGRLSHDYTSTNFWTNRPPNAPALTSPADNSQVSALLNVTFTWNASDPDPSDPQAAWQLRYRKAATPISDAGEWVATDVHTGDDETWTIDAGTFKGNTFYEWQVRTRDAQNAWGEWAFPRSFYVLASTTPPLILSPDKGTAIVASRTNRFRWKFRDPEVGVSQHHADFRYRVFGGIPGDWETIFGDVTTPGSDQFWDMDPGTFETEFLYAYQVRTIGTTAKTSDWSEEAYFWTARTPGSGAGLEVISSGRPQDPLGMGANRAFVYARGGETLIGELKPLTTINWNRKRDDISGGSLIINQWDDEGRLFLGSLRTWQHEVVVFRDSVRVFEGPITRIAASKDRIEIEFKDVMAYVYRRIMRQGYADNYQVVNGEQLGLTTVVNRGAQIILNALAYDDPNVLPYLTILDNVGDAKNSRVRKDFSSTAWEEVDDLAAHAGLDYTTAGRRILLNDTHRPVGRLPEMGDGDFSDPPVVTEYGMELANVLAVTNNNGIYGIAYRGVDADHVPLGPEGFVEMLDSAYGESEGAGTEQTLTREARKRLVATLTAQATRNIGGRYTTYGPAPLVVRVPDNSTLSPDVNLGINQLIPGVWIPVRSSSGVRDVAQWQKLDAIGVTQDANGEKIAVTMSAAPNDGNDPDADEAAAEEAG